MAGRTSWAVATVAANIRQRLNQIAFITIVPLTDCTKSDADTRQFK
jgi:hypothetical protein